MTAALLRTLFTLAVSAASLTLMARSAAAQGASITGVVRRGDVGTPVPDTRLDVPELNAAVSSDSAGAYRLTGLSAGTVTLHASHTGYDTVSVLVTVTAESQLRVDISLSPQAVVLDSVRVHAPPPSTRQTPFHNGVDDGETWTWLGDPSLSLASTGEPDLVRMLSADPHLPLRPDWPGSLTDHGGTSDQLLVRLDGLPIWSPVHGSGNLSVITPDAIGRVTVRDGAIPADIGDRLGGVLDVETRAPPTVGSTGAGYLGPAAMRATWARPLAIGDANGGIHIAVRHSNDEDALAHDAGALPDHWTDGVVTTEMSTVATTVRLVLLASSDRALPYGESFSSTTPSTTTIPWNTGTLGAIWTQRLGGATTLESRVSAARFGATVPAAIDTTHQSLDDAVLQTELATQLSWHAVTAGVSLDILDVNYRVTNAAISTTGLQPVSFRGTPTIAAAFVERRWGPADSAWHVTTGLRGMALFGTTARLEPRVDAALRIVPGLIATLGYARTHQAVQSLRNPESPLGAEIGVDFPVAAGTGGVPLAQSDVGTAGIIANVGAAGRLSVDGYLRSLSGLAIADPLQPALFATTGFVHASARVEGVAAQLNGARGRFAWQLGYGAGRTIQSAAGIQYETPSELGQTASVALGVALDHLTQIRLAGWAGFGQHVPGLDGTSLGRDDGDPASPGTGDHDLTTSWATATRLPPYLRFDLQLAHQWRVGPARGRLSTYITLANMFNHSNIAAQIPTGPGGTLRNVTLLPRTVLFGLGWAY